MRDEKIIRNFIDKYLKWVKENNSMFYDVEKNHITNVAIDIISKYGETYKCLGYFKMQLCNDLYGKLYENAKAKDETNLKQLLHESCVLQFCNDAVGFISDNLKLEE